jgi:deazaflavin-dependent oxidoreductase (nitroreductase family)
MNWSATMTASTSTPTASAPRFGGILWKLARSTSGLLKPLAGHRWNPVFAILEHRGRRSGRSYATPLAVRRDADGFVIALAFGSQVDWYRNLLAAGEGSIRWRDRTYAIGAPQPLEAERALAAFHPIQRAALRLGGIHAFIRVPVVADQER